MKKILLSTIVLTAFSLSILLFQISCKKSANASPVVNSVTQQGKLIYGKLFYGAATSAATYDHYEIWSCNYDGTGQQKIDIALPANVLIESIPKLSPDNKTMFFTVATYVGGSQIISPESVDACNIDGTNVHEVIAQDGQNTGLEPAAAY